ncbi:putative unusual protein kinase regulating ubiquinone biosynthesis (AarF/ABC1/UbiB family) [Luteimonas sp. J16]|jgi:ubiquinone biosynthesis protein|nr:AarF/UbiB family protein [Luteimonas sp. J29]TWG91236.1 putative unusual protein kinase regulating ubiquinone biosynthesis (AarF/ABC1/UbiB family) [Luteimonas sp. J16]
MQRLSRTSQVIAMLARYRSAGILTGFDLGEAEEDPIDGETDELAERFVADLEAMGPAFVKLGQALSTRPDLVPASWITALERTQDDATPAPVDDIEALLEKELGVRASKVFSEIDPEPMAAASLAQVHRAVLRDGRVVALKIQRPDVACACRVDLDVLAGLAGTADALTDAGRRMRLADWIAEFRKAMLDELDYRIEAENLDRFARHLAGYARLRVPRPLWDYVTPRLLVMEWIDGINVTRISGLRRTEEDTAPATVELLRAYLDQVFVHGDIHADPHPGNVLLCPDGRIALIDLGMVATIPPRQRERLLKLVFAAVDGRGEDVERELVALGTRLEDFDESACVREVSQVVARYSGSARPTSEGRMVLELVRRSTECGLRTPPEISLLGKTLLNLERVVDALAPGVDVRREIESHLQSLMRERLRQSLSPTNLAAEAMELQELVREAPRKLSDALSLVAANRLQVRLAGLDDSRLMENLQKIANRIASAVVIAALLLSSTQIMRLEGGPRLLGYPALAMLMFLVAAVLGLMLVVSAMRRDRLARPVERSGTE